MLEKVLSEVLLINLKIDFLDHDEIHEDVLVRIFTAITNFQLTISNRCRREYEDTIARIIREQLQIIFLRMLSKKHPTYDVQTRNVAAAMLSWGIYGASVEWKRSKISISAEEYIRSVIPFM